jgi:hypothetical protein
MNQQRFLVERASGMHANAIGVMDKAFLSFYFGFKSAYAMRLTSKGISKSFCFVISSITVALTWSGFG